MGIFEANQIFMECDRFAKHLSQTKKAINELFDHPNQNDLDMYIRSNDELIMLTKWRIEQLEETLEKVGWWQKKVARGYIKKIQYEYLQTQWSLGQLQEKSRP